MALEFIEYVFLLQFSIVIGLFLYKLYNVLTVGENNNINISVLTLIGFVLVWGVGLLSLLYDTGVNLLFSALFKLEAWLFVLYFIFFIIEVFFLYKSTITGSMERHTPKRRY